MVNPSLDLPQVADNQNQKEATINDATGSLDRAVTDSLAVEMSGGDVTLTNDQYRRHIMFICSGQTQARTLNVPNIKRLFAVRNASTTFVVNVTRGTTVIELAENTTMMFYSDGTANGLISVAGGAGSGGQSPLTVIGRQTANNVANIDFTFDPTLYESLTLFCDDIVIATSGGHSLILTISEDNGSTFETGASDYLFARTGLTSGGSTNQGSSSGRANFLLGTSQDTVAGNVSNMELNIRSINDGVRTSFDGMYNEYADGGDHRVSNIAGRYNGSTNATNGIRIAVTSGNITSGRFMLMGRLK